MYRSILAAVTAAFLLSGCMAAITYPKDRSIADVPGEYQPVAIASILESSMMGDTEIPNSKYENILGAVKQSIEDVFKEKSIETSPTSDGANVLIHARVYWLPYNPIIGGHINVYLKAYDKTGTQLFTGFSGADFTLINFMVDGGETGVADRIARKAATSVADELRKKQGK